MNVKIIAKDIELNQANRSAIMRRLDYALDRFQHLVSRVSVTLADINGPRGGEDMLCRIRLFFNKIGVVQVEQTRRTLTEAVDRATDILHRTVSRRIERHYKNHHTMDFGGNWLDGRLAHAKIRSR